MVSIDIRSLKEGFQELEFTPTAEELGVENPAFRDIRTEIQVTVDGEQIVVRVYAEAIARLTCDRTLEDFDKRIKGIYTVVFMPESDIDDDAKGDGIQPLPGKRDDLDLTDIVRDTLMLAVPIRKIAPGAEEMDIPTSFGESSESDIDPRWKELEKLRSSSEESPE